MKQFVMIMLTLFVGTFAHAHARLKASAGVVPRSTNAGIKTGPCGGLPRVSSPAHLRGGQTLTVKWEETIQHPGRFEFYLLSAADTQSELLEIVQDNQDNGATLPHQYSIDLVIPNETCTNCTLQMQQVMTENPASPTLYYSCADMSITKSGSTPSPSPTPCPN